MYKFLNRDTFTEFVEDVMATEFISLDTETSSLDTITCKFYLFQVKVNNQVYIFNALEEGQELFTKVVDFIQSSGRTIIAHNAKFDLKVIYRFSNILLANVYDTMIVEAMINNGLSRKWSSLVELVEKYALILMSKEARVEFYSENFDGIVTNEMYNYACMDVLYLEEIRKQQIEELEKLKLMRVLDLEMKLVPVITSIEITGVLIDETKWRNLETIARNESEKCRNALLDFFVETLKIGEFSSALELADTIKIKDINGVKGAGNRIGTRKVLETITDGDAIIDFFRNNLNVNSSAQLLILLNKAGISIKATNEKVLKKFRNVHLAVDMLLTYREWGKKISTYGLSFLDNIHPETGRIHSDFNQMGAASGRFSSGKPNLQNIPAEKEYRECFIARKGYKIVAIDYSQQEIRISGEVSKDPVIIDAYKNKIDIHATTASFMYGVDIKDVTKEQRQNAKTLNFACLPMDTDILTRDGWKQYSDISIGDSVLGYNQPFDRLEWTVVHDKFFYESSPVVEMKATGLNLRCTPNHRWYGDKRFRYKGRKDVYKNAVFTSEDIAKVKNSEHRFILSAPYFNKSSLDITKEEAGIIGWIFSDGSLKISEASGKTSQGADNRRQGVLASIFQSRTYNQPKVDEILKILPKDKFHVYERPTGITQFSLFPEYSRDLLKRANLFEEQDFSRFVLSLDEEQLSEFVKAIILAEGWVANRVSQRFAQNTGKFLDACLLSFFLSGNFVSFVDRIQYTGNNNRNVCIRKRRFTTQRIKIQSIEEQAVFCLKTPLNTFVARQKEIPFITGNSIYGTTDYGLSKTFGVSSEEATRLRENVSKGYPRLFKYKEMVENFAVEHKFSKTLLGRIRFFKEQAIYFDFEKEMAQIRREGFNHLIQGTAADMTKLAMIYVYSENPFGDKLRMLMPEHDEIVAEIREDVVEEGYQFICDMMIKAGDFFMKNIETVVEGTKGDCWTK